MLVDHLSRAMADLEADSDFIVLDCPGSHTRLSQMAHAVAERFRAHMASHPVTVDGVALRCTVSAGVACLLDGEGGVDLLLKRADQALYAAKRAGRNRVERWRPELGGAKLRQPEGGRDAA